MPIIINGGSYSAGSWWAKHLENGETNERVELVEFTGLTADALPDAFREMQGLAAGTKCKNYFYQANINPREDEQLTPAQWREAVDRLEKNLGLTGQPRFVVEHEKKGRTHRHVVWSRIDQERGVAISDSLTAPIHERTSRELEIIFDLERGQSILVPDRGSDRPERRPRKNETFRAAESGIDPQVVSAELKSLWQCADNGQSFKAALEASGDYVLARGDRRDFVVIDRAGDDHSLARRLSVKVADVRARLADIDPTGLPSVEEAKAQQHARHSQHNDRDAEYAASAEKAAARRYDPLRAAEQEFLRAQFKGRYDELRAAEPPPEIVRAFETTASRAAKPAAPIYDRDADNAAWEAKLTEAAIAKAEATPAVRQQPEADTAREARTGAAEPTGGPEKRPEADDTRPLGKTAGDIRMAWTLSRSAEELESALAAHGITLAQVSPEEARQSEMTAASAETGSFAPVLKAGEIVAVNEHGHVHRLTQRTTGDTASEIEGRFPGIDHAGLLSVTDAKEVMQEAARATWRHERQAERERARPAGAIETAIAEALTSTMTGHDFAAALDAAGLTVARATAADVKALDALRYEAALAALVAHAETERVTVRHLATVEAGEIVVVTRTGNVFRLSPQRMDFEDIEQRLADVQSRLPSVAEARALNEINRERTADFWAELRASNMAAREARTDALAAQQEIREATATAKHATHATRDAAEDTLDVGSRATGKLIGGLAKAVEGVLAGLFGFFGAAEPKLTPMQAELAARAAEQRQAEAAHLAAAAERAARLDELLSQIARDDAERRRQERQRGAAGDLPVEQHPTRDDGYEREREP